jgi:hypothetical protein
VSLPSLVWLIINSGVVSCSDFERLIVVLGTMRLQPLF